MNLLFRYGWIIYILNISKEEEEEKKKKNIVL